MKITEFAFTAYNFLIEKKLLDEFKKRHPSFNKLEMSTIEETVNQMTKPLNPPTIEQTKDEKAEELYLKMGGSL